MSEDSKIASSLVGETSTPPQRYPIQLNPEQERQVRLWAADDRLWTTQETVEFNLRTFARTILNSFYESHSPDGDGHEKGSVVAGEPRTPEIPSALPKAVEALGLGDGSNPSGSLTPPAAVGVQAPPGEPREWRCFHCDEVFTDKAEAREHFGATLYRDPACQMPGADIKHIRGLEERNAELEREKDTLENDARLWHESESDRVRRIGQCQWWQALDSKEGERLALEAELARLRAERDVANDECKAAGAGLEPAGSLTPSSAVGVQAPPGDGSTPPEAPSMTHEQYLLQANEALRAELARLRAELAAERDLNGHAALGDALTAAEAECATLKAERDEAQRQRNEFEKDWNAECDVRERRDAELAALREQVYVPNQWVCPTCGFVLSKMLLRASDGAVGIDTTEVQEICSNDGSSLVRLTYEQASAENGKNAVENAQRYFDLRSAVQQQVEHIHQWFVLIQPKIEDARPDAVFLQASVLAAAKLLHEIFDILAALVAPKEPET